jgi:hypothetical protein
VLLQSFNDFFKVRAYIDRLLIHHDISILCADGNVWFDDDAGIFVRGFDRCG